jgi:aminopeptidase N
MWVIVAISAPQLLQRSKEQMKSIKIFIVIAALIVGLVSWLTSTVDGIEKASPVTLDPRVSKSLEQQGNLALAEKLLEVNQAISQAIDAPHQLVLEKELVLKKQEIDKNIKLLTENLYNQNERVVIQARLAVLLEDYNQSALPLILNQMSASATQ